MNRRTSPKDIMLQYDYGMDAATSALVQSLAVHNGQAFALSCLPAIANLSKDAFWSKESGIGFGLDTGKFCVEKSSGALRPSVERISQRISRAITLTGSQKWRFRRCLQERNFWLSVCAVTEPKQSRFDRFEECGKSFAIEYSPSTEKTRVRVKTCSNRFCPACNERLGRERMEILQRPLTGRTNLKFVTLTLQHSEIPLAKQIKHLKQSFRRLRQSQSWRMSHGIAVIECKLTARNEWHPHLHIICAGNFMPNQVLSDAWRIASRGSYIVKIKGVRKTSEALKYCAKYCCKPCRNIDNLRANPERACELYSALQRVKMSWHFGDKSLWNPPAEKEQVFDPKDWRVVYTWRDLTRELSANNPIAHDQCRALGIFPADILEAGGT